MAAHPEWGRYHSLSFIIEGGMVLEIDALLQFLRYQKHVGEMVVLSIVLTHNITFYLHLWGISCGLSQN